MHPLSTRSFEQRVGEAVAEIERSTAAELVVVVVPRSAPHGAIPLAFGVVGLFAVFTALMFADVEVGDYLLYAGPLVAFFAAYAIVRVTPPLQRLALGKRARRRATEILARATFQKAGLHETRDATAILIFLSLVERACVLVCDRGVLLAAGEPEWASLESAFVKALGARKSDVAVLDALGNLGRVLRDRLPPRADDIDELPSRIRVTF